MSDDLTKVPWPKGQLKDAADLVDMCRLMPEYFDASLVAEVQTDKPLAKVLPCQFCRRPLVVSTFYVLAWAKCSPCKGEDDSVRKPGSLDVVQAGRTDPVLAKDLTKTLVNPHFAVARCPVHPDDDEHVMKIIHVNHNDNYGPYVLAGFKDGRSVYKQTAPGETVLLQCQHSGCLATVQFSTTAVIRFKPMNEPRNDDGRHVNGYWQFVGIRDPESEPWADYPPPADDDEETEAA